MTSMQIEKAKVLLEEVKKHEREKNPGQCKMFSMGGACSCVLCLCDELHGLLDGVCQGQHMTCGECELIRHASGFCPNHPVGGQAAPK